MQQRRGEGGASEKVSEWMSVRAGEKTSEIERERERERERVRECERERET